MGSRHIRCIRRALQTFAATLLVAVPHASIAQSVFSHSVPLKLPKGANGIQPELALTYNPGASNGPLGVGWQLSGLSVITRVNYGDGISYSARDTYAHSLLGVLVPQPDGSYRTKKESFVKFEPVGTTCGSGPCSWIAHDRSGLKIHYGNTSSSQLRLPGQSVVRTWGVSSANDVFGNSYSVTYTNPDGTRIYPDSVTYGAGPNSTATRVVAFQYEMRTVRRRRDDGSGHGGDLFA